MTVHFDLENLREAELSSAVGVTTEGKGVIAFSLTGPDYYPSSAFLAVGEHNNNDNNDNNKIIVSAMGQSPQDGRTEYELTPFYNPRWGDYAAAVAFGKTIFFATEYIQSPNCDVSAWLTGGDTTCGGTRSRVANWGTSLNAVQA